MFFDSKEGCCLQIYLISPGVPFLPLASSSNTDFNEENELLLPPGLVLTYIGVVPNVPIFGIPANLSNRRNDVTSRHMPLTTKCNETNLFANVSVYRVNLPDQVEQNAAIEEANAKILNQIRAQYNSASAPV